jgi:hypothetical protein
MTQRRAVLICFAEETWKLASVLYWVEERVRMYFHTTPGRLAASDSMDTRSWRRKLTTHRPLLPKLRMSGAKSPFLHMPSYRLAWQIYFFTYIPCILMLLKFFHLPTDAQVNCLKNNFKIYIKIDIKTAPTCFGVITIIRDHVIRSC